MIKVTKKEKLLLAIIFRQVYLTSYRSGFSYHEFVPFFIKNKELYHDLHESLISKIPTRTFKFHINKIFYFNSFCKNKFYNKQLIIIIKIYKDFIDSLNYDIDAYNNEYIEIGNNIKIVDVGKKTEIYYHYVLYKKLTKRERKYISQVEHIGQNMRVHDKYYSIEELQKTLNF